MMLLECALLDCALMCNTFFTFMLKSKGGLGYLITCKQSATKKNASEIFNRLLLAVASWLLANALINTKSANWEQIHRLILSGVEDVIA